MGSSRPGVAGLEAGLGAGGPRLPMEGRLDELTHLVLVPLEEGLHHAREHAFGPDPCYPPLVATMPYPSFLGHLMGGCG